MDAELMRLEIERLKRENEDLRRRLRMLREALLGELQ